MPNLYPFLTYVLVTTFTPGPNNILSMSNAMRYGYRRTLRFLAGVGTGFVVMLLIAGLLNVLIERVMPRVHIWLELLGAAYLVYLAAHLAFSKPRDGAPADPRLNTFGAGFALQFVNLKGILYGVTVFAMFITPIYQGSPRRRSVCCLAGLRGFRVRQQLGVGRQPFPQLSEQVRALVQSGHGGAVGLHGRRQPSGAGPLKGQGACPACTPGTRTMVLRCGGRVAP